MLHVLEWENDVYLPGFEPETFSFQVQRSATELHHIDEIGHMCLLYNEVKRRRARLVLGWVTAWKLTLCIMYISC